eukprot:CAMPEP_0206478928 /NCGR_PEP_ID=MMETSP0324_2-20121206/36379_1 /ASSEMBLY_ACC=CAM_ASM_000836 /TAXON_ID=2866 /ORGANISM="Crypthecodinium cohnii, Strain Seligo" /LENGTH=103 /DNA_ID=CAMNT_0053955395 /DNA_START=768 /DNA_END=1080 /DNA_ORIENTATION=-
MIHAAPTKERVINSAGTAAGACMLWEGRVTAERGRSGLSDGGVLIVLGASDGTPEILAEADGEDTLGAVAATQGTSLVGTASYTFSADTSRDVDVATWTKRPI